MNKRYVVFAALFILVAGGLLLLPERYNFRQVEPEEMLLEITLPTRYFSVDDVAARIIDGDPSLMLLDVRDSIQYQYYTLPGAYNLPLGLLLEPDSRLFFEQKGKDVVFFSNDDIDAEKAWMLIRRQGYENLYVMKGGLNEWAVTIINPPVPGPAASSGEIAMYQFRRAAAQTFADDSLVMQSAAAPASRPSRAAEPLKLKKRERDVQIDGGC